MKTKTILKVIGILIFLGVIIFTLFNIIEEKKENKEVPILEQIAIKETKNVYVKGWNCLDYSRHYNKTFSENYPQLDVRWIRRLDICNNKTYCNSLHTYILINGYGGECIIDQHHVACVQLITIK